MWSPTHVQVTVQRAKSLLTKGKHKTNDCFVTIALGKEKYQTSVKEKANKDVEWHEECELQIPEQGNTAEIVLTALHRNFLGVDEFLGTVSIPLSSFDVYERPKNRWYTLGSKPGRENSKERGELEIKIGFIVKAGSLTDLSRKERHKSSLGQLSTAAQSIGGSLLSIGSLEKRKGLKKLAKSIGNRVKGKSKSKLDQDNDLDEREETGYRVTASDRIATGSRQKPGEADPGVISEDEDEFTFDDLSHKSSASSLSGPMVVPTSGTTPTAGINNFGSATATTSSNNTRSLNHSNVNIAVGGNERSTVASTTSVGAAPNKPPRSGISSSATSLSNIDGQRDDEWGLKLYGKQASNIPKRWDSKANPRIVIDELSRSDFADQYEFESASTTMTPTSTVSTLSLRSSSPVILMTSATTVTTTTASSNTTTNASTTATIPSSSSPISSRLRETPEPPNPAPRDILQPKNNKEDKFLSSNKENKIDYKSPKEDKQSKKERRREREKENRLRDVIEIGHSSSERIIIGGEDALKTSFASQSRLPHEIVAQFEGKSREDLIELIFQLKTDLADKKKRLTDLEDYIDALLLRVIECSPRLLQNPFHMQRRLSSPGHQ